MAAVSTSRPAIITIATRVTGRVLCVEDNDMGYFLVSATFETHLPGVSLLRASTAAEAIRLARSSYQPHLILQDLRLPDQPGIEVVRELNREITSGLIDVVVVTADKMTPDLVKARALGVREVIFKPFDITQLVAVVAAVLTARTATTTRG